MSEGQTWLTILIAAAGLILTIMTFVSMQGKNLRELISSGDKAVLESAAKSRHDLANTMTVAFNTLRSDVETLKRETASKAEVAAAEGRAAQTSNRLEGKLDRLGEQLTELGAIKAALHSLNDQYTSIAKRLDAREGRP